MTTHLSSLPPELDPRGPRRPPPGAPRSGGGGPAWRRPLGIVAIVLSACVLIASGGAYAWYRYLNGNVTRVSGITSTGGTVASDGAENVLLVGSDSRTGEGDSFAQAPTDQTQVEGARSDTVILAHLAPGNQKATLVSLPRDSWVTIPAYTDTKGVSHPAHQDKLNSAFSLGGAALLVKTVQNLTGIHVDHYAEIDFGGFQKMVTALGGVQVCLSQPAHDVQTGLNLTAGTHELNGQQALEFVRQRYGLPLGDIDRIKRQQQFMAAMLRKVISAGTLTNPIKLNSFLTALTGSITVDSGMGFSDMKTLALKLKDMSAGNVALTTMPLSGFATEDGQDVDIIDTTRSTALFDSLKSDNPASPATVVVTPSATPLTVPVGQVHVQVFNGAGVRGLATTASADLKKLGYAVVGPPANRGTGASATLIEYGPTQAEAARTLAASLSGATLQPEASLGADIQLVLGSSYHTAVAPGAAPVATASASAGVATGSTTAASTACTD